MEEFKKLAEQLESAMMELRNAFPESSSPFAAYTAVSDATLELSGYVTAKKGRTPEARNAALTVAAAALFFVMDISDDPDYEVGLDEDELKDDEPDRFGELAESEEEQE